MIASEAKLPRFLLKNVGPTGRFGGKANYPKIRLNELESAHEINDNTETDPGGSAWAFDNANQGLCRHKASGAFCLLIRFS